MTVDPRTPCIIGVATHTWHPEDVGAEGAPEPLEMWDHVARAAATDAGNKDLLAALDSIQIVYCQTWQYDDAVARLAERLGADPSHRHYSGIGGTTTQQLVNETSEAMLARRDGSRARSRARRRSRPSGSASAPANAGSVRSRRPTSGRSRGSRRRDPVEVAHEVFQAWLTFAVFDNARRAELGSDSTTTAPRSASCSRR